MKKCPAILVSCCRYLVVLLGWWWCWWCWWCWQTTASRCVCYACLVPCNFCCLWPTHLPDLPDLPERIVVVSRVRGHFIPTHSNQPAMLWRNFDPGPPGCWVVGLDDGPQLILPHLGETCWWCQCWWQNNFGFGVRFVQITNHRDRRPPKARSITMNPPLQGCRVPLLILRSCRMKLQSGFTGGFSDRRIREV